MTIKQGRMSDRIQQILSQLLLREVSDPRLRNITVTEVQLDPELMYAKVYCQRHGRRKPRDRSHAWLAPRQRLLTARGGQTHSLAQYTGVAFPLGSHPWNMPNASIN